MEKRRQEGDVEAMLTKKQLEHAAECNGCSAIWRCPDEGCVLQVCVINTSKTALAYREMLKRLIEWNYFCPICGRKLINSYNAGHAENCELAELLREEST
jgi:hypothetical protein